MSADFEMPKAYQPQSVEDNVAKLWEQSGVFNPDKQSNVDEGKDPFSIVLPPPNVTGTLHMGHAMMLAIEDVMVRFARMQGRKTVWIPGTDHAAIATQSKVEKIIKEESGQTRHDLGREAFLERVNQFAQDSHDTIVGQVKKMGASVDWSREAYTLDEARHEAVNTAFKRMFDDGLIYRGHRIVNWDPIGQTTVSDDEVVHKEVQAKLYTFKYAADFPIPIATTRPETKVGDTAVAVHPEGKWKEYIGQEFDVEFAGSKLHLKVIGDENVEEEFGTGALGVTPAHSQIDFEMAQKNDVPVVQVIDEEAKMMESAGQLVAGMTAKEAREAVVAWLHENDLMIQEDDVQQNLSTAERTGGVIEPLPKEQWFIDVNKEFAFTNSERVPIKGLNTGDSVTLKQLMKHVVESGQIEILPDRFKKTYFHWINNLRDWNISRQIWFGHRVPVWYGNESASGTNSSGGANQQEMHVGSNPEGEGWVQDEDTLDTWFSSGLWTFSTLGWPNKEAADYNTFHPTSVLETGYDILFFWVARMILMSTYLVGEIPFKTVYLHGLVRDDQGRKMSKSLGNIINPLDMIQDYGADATRLSLVIGATPGNDMKLSEEKVAGFRNFTNKLWNISRFVLSSVEDVQSVKNVEPVTLSDKWILAQLSSTAEKVTQHLEQFEYSLAGETLRDFTWNDFADWYIEIAKVQNNKNTQRILLYVLERILKMWHPFMPFVTEEIYRQFNNGLLAVADWPEERFADDVSAFGMMQEIISQVRNVRARYTIAPSKEVELYIAGIDLNDDAAVIKRLARLSDVHFVNELPDMKSAATFALASAQISIPLEGIVDFEAEKARMQKEIDALSQHRDNLKGRLGNDSYVNNAPAELVEQTRQQLAETEDRLQKMEEELQGLN